MNMVRARHIGPKVKGHRTNREGTRLLSGNTPKVRTVLTWQPSAPAPRCPPPLSPACQLPTGLCPVSATPVTACPCPGGPHQPLLSCSAEQAVSGEGREHGAGAGGGGRAGGRGPDPGPAGRPGQGAALGGLCLAVLWKRTGCPPPGQPLLTAPLPCLVGSSGHLWAPSAVPRQPSDHLRQPWQLLQHKVCEFGLGLDLHLPGGLCAVGGLPGYTARGSDCPAPEPAGGGGSRVAGGRPGLPAHRGPDRLLLRASAPGPAAPRAAGSPQLPGGRPPVAGLHGLLPHLPAHLLLPAHGRGSSSVRQVSGPWAACRRTSAPCLPAQRAAAGPLELLAALHRHLFPPVYSQGGGGRRGYLCLVPHLWQLVSSALVSRQPRAWALPSSPLQPQA